MSKEEKSVVAVSTTTSIKEVERLISKIKTVVDTPYKTPKKISTATGKVVDISEVTDVSTLVSLFSGVAARIEAMSKAQETLGVTTMPVPKVDGGTLEEWVSDIKLRIEIINQKEKLDQLQSIKKRWEELLDKEDRKAQLLEEMKSFQV